MAVIYDISYLYLQNVIGRCSQPLVGPNGRRSREDEKLMTAFNVKVELVSKELNHFGVIASLFWQIGGHCSRFVLVCSF